MHFTEWRPRHAAWQFGSYGGAAIGKLTSFKPLDHAMSPSYKCFLRVVTAILGFGGLAAVVLHTRALFSSFELWKLIMCILALPSVAGFLVFAFHRERVRHSPGGDSGTASAVVLWPSPTKPPSLSARAAAEIPEHHD